MNNNDQPQLATCYYPEHWPESRWATDAELMRALGIRWVRVGEFSWSRLEPSRGDLQFDWLERAINSLGAAGLGVILGTPTATPPKWLVDSIADMLAHGADSRPRTFGSRRHYCFSSQAYRDECARIVATLAERFGNNPHVHFWQTDNEYGCHDTTRSYSPAARAAFRAWLEQRYGSIDKLNDAWGNVFWSMEYHDFAAVELPNQCVTEANPAHWLDFYRFSSEQVRSFNALQTDILRPYHKPILHNYMGASSTSTTTNSVPTSTSPPGIATPSAFYKHGQHKNPIPPSHPSTAKATPTSKPCTTTSTAASVVVAGGSWSNNPAR